VFTNPLLLPPTLFWLLLCSALGLGLVVPTFTRAGRPRRARRDSTPKLVSAGRHRRLNPEQATAAEAALARVVTEGPGFSGNTMKLPCRECGRRAVPPVPVVDSPWIPTELMTLVAGGSGWQIVATCTECYGPLISRVLDDELAAHAVSIGVVHAIGADL
jgi:hypothetical protein